MRRNLLAHAAAALAALALTIAPGPAAAQPTAQPDPAKLAEAKKHMEAGAAFYNDPTGHKCEEAYREFSKAYELSGSLNALKNMGVCALELERDGEAIEHFEKFLAGKGDKADAAERTQIESDLKALKAAVAWVTLKSNRPGVQVTDTRTPSRGTPITNRYTVGPDGLRVGIHPGAHSFTASVEGAPDVVWRAEISNGGSYEHTFELVAPGAQKPEPGPTPKGAGEKQPAAAPPPAEVAMERPVPASVYVFAGLTVACAVPMTIFMLKAKSDRDAFDASNNGTLPQAEMEDLRSTVTTSNLLADVFLGATAASLVTTGVLFFTRPERPVQQTGSWVLSPTITTRGGGAVVSGRF